VSYSNKKAKILTDWIKSHSNVIENYEVVDTEIEKKSGRFEHKIQLTEDYHINDRKVVQDPSAEDLIWMLSNLLEEE
jgi:hypothetical protein